MFVLTTHGSTRALDLSIVEERARYASERVDFHKYFDDLTVAGIQRVLRGEEARSPEAPCRKQLVDHLLYAQQSSPHRLWELLLVQAYEGKLVERRLAVSSEEDPRLDALVVETFIASLADLYAFDDAREIHLHVMRRSGAALKRALGGSRARGGKKTLQARRSRTAPVVVPAAAPADGRVATTAKA